MGKGVTVAVLDTGVNDRHVELQGQVVRGFNATEEGGPSETSDIWKGSHGTFVASLIAAKANNFGMVGVAPQAKVMPIRVFVKDASKGTRLDVARGLDLIPSEVQIANLSFGERKNYQVNMEAMQRATKRGLLLVVSAGNEAASKPLKYPARYANESWANGQIMVVGCIDAGFFRWDPNWSVDPHWRAVYLRSVLGVSNLAGDMKNFYLLAPGMHVRSAIGDTSELGVDSGTSFAAPHVSGVAALIKSRWSKLRAEEIASILFRTATDLGPKGVDDIFGHGLLNAERAMQPLGKTVVPMPSGITVRTVSMIAPAASGNSLKTQVIKAVAFDEFNRDFGLDLSSAIRTPTAPLLVGTLADADRRSALVDKVLPDGSRLVASVAQPAAAAGAAETGSLGGVSYVQRFDSGAEVALGGNGFAHHFFGAANEFDVTRGFAASAATPLFALVPGHSHVGLSLPFAGEWKAKAGLLSTAGAKNFASQLAPASIMPTAQLMVGGISRVKGDTAIGITVGQLAENEALLGGRSTEGLRIEGAPRTRFATLDGAARLGDKWAGFANYTVALTAAHRNSANSLIEGNSALRGDSFALGLMRADAWKTGDKLSFAVLQPLRLRSGGMDVLAVEAEDEAGNLVFGRQSLSMVPTGRELRSEVNYNMPLGRQQSVAGFLMHRANPGHDNSQAREIAAGVSWNKAF